MTAISAAVRCPQLIYTSARRTLRGSGLGVLAHSASWPAELGLDQRRLGGLVRAPQRDLHGVATTELGLIRRGGGAVLYRKGDGGTDSSGRRGNYVVHLLWDATGTLTPRELPLLMRWSAESLITLDPTADLDEALLEPLGAEELGLDPEDELPVAAAVERLLEGEGDVHLPRALPSGRATVGTVFHAVPWRLLAGASCVDGEEPDGDEAQMRIRLDGQVWPAEASAFARAVTAAASEGRLPDSSATVEDLDVELNVQGWADGDPDLLSASQVVSVLRSPAGGRWAELHAGTVLHLLEQDGTARGPLADLSRRSDGVRRALRRAGIELIERRLLAGRSIPQSVLDLAGVTQSDASTLFHRWEDDGRRLGPVARDDVDLVAAVLASDGTLHPLRLLPTDQLGDLVRHPRIAAAVLRDIPSIQDPAIRRAAARALLRDDPGHVEPLATVLSGTELTGLLAEEALDVGTEEDLERLVDAAARIPGRRGLALRSVVFSAPRELAVGVVRRRGAELLADDGWPDWLIDAVVRPRQRARRWGRRSTRDA